MKKTYMLMIIMLMVAIIGSMLGIRKFAEMDLNKNLIKLNGTEIKLSASNIKDENSFISKEKVAPITKKINLMAPKFDYTFDKLSSTVIRLK